VSEKKYPKPAEIKKARLKVSKTQGAAAAVIGRGWRVWQMYEAGQRKFDPILWQVWLIRVGLEKPESIL